MTQEDPKIEGLGDRTLQAKQARRNDRKMAAAALMAAVAILVVGGIIGSIFLFKQSHDISAQSRAINQLGSSVDTLRGQQEYCSQPKVPKSDPRCQTPAAPPAKEIIGAQGVPGDQGVQGPQGAQGVQGIQGVPGVPGQRGPQGLPGSSPACLLEVSRCVGATGAEGKPGASSTIPGPTGLEGKPGAASTVPGPAGPDGKQGVPGGDSTVPGPVGPAGPEGPKGADSTVAGPPGKSAFPFVFDFTFMDALQQPVTMECTITEEAQPAVCAQKN